MYRPAFSLALPRSLHPRLRLSRGGVLPRLASYPRWCALAGVLLANLACFVLRLCVLRLLTLLVLLRRLSLTPPLPRLRCMLTNWPCFGALLLLRLCRRLLFADPDSRFVRVFEFKIQVDGVGSCLDFGTATSFLSLRGFGLVPASLTVRVAALPGESLWWVNRQIENPKKPALPPRVNGW